MIRRRALEIFEERRYRQITAIAGGMWTLLFMAVFLLLPGHMLVDHDFLLGVAGIWSLGVAFIVNSSVLAKSRRNLREQEAKFHLLFDRSPHPTALIDLSPQGAVFVAANEAACAVLRLPHAELIGLPAADVMHGVDHETVRSIADTVRTQGRVILEQTLQPAQGPPVLVEMELHAFDIAGRPGILAIASDLGNPRTAERIVGRRDRQLTLLSSVTRHMNEHLEVREVLRRCSEAALEIVGAAGCMVGLVEGAEIVFREYVHADDHTPIDLRFHRGVGVAGRVWEECAAYVSNDVAHDPRARWDVVRRFGMSNLVAVPLLDGEGKFLGCVEVHDAPGGRPFDDDDALVLSGVAASAGIALANARVLDELMQTRGELLEYQERLRSLSVELSRTEEQERRRISSALHDTIGQVLAISRMKIGQAAARDLGADAGRLVADVRELIDHAISDTRSLTFELSPPLLYELGLEPALEWLCEQTVQRHGIDCAFTDEGGYKPVSDDLRALLYACTRELVFNSLKHSGADRIDVSIGRDGDSLRICVSDDGAGFDRSGATAPASGFGLFSIRERLRGFGGALRLDSSPGAGTAATIRAPLDDMFLSDVAN